VGRKTGLDAVPDAMRAAIARTPPWPLFRIGEPIVDLLYTTVSATTQLSSQAN